MPPPDGHRAARARSTSERLARAALVNPEAHLLRAHYFHECHVGAIREARVILYGRTEPVHGRAVDRGDADYRVRIADRDRTDLDLAARNLQRIDISLAARFEGERLRIEVRHAHVDRHQAIVAHARSHQSSGTIHHDFARPEFRAAGDERGDATRAVAALLDLDAVGIDDAIEDAGVGTARRFQDKCLVETDAGVPAGQFAEGAGVGDLPARSIEDHEVVAESMHLHEINLHAARIPQVPPALDRGSGPSPRTFQRPARVQLPAH